MLFLKDKLYKQGLKGGGKKKLFSLQTEHFWSQCMGFPPYPPDLQEKFHVLKFNSVLTLCTWS